MFELSFFTDDLLIFFKAKEDQLECIKEGLDQFCKCSGNASIFHKSSMFISPNILEVEAERLSVKMGIPRRKEIGKYLGHFIVQDDKNKDRHKELLQRVHSKVDGWKLNCLSKARRITLAQSVLGSLPIFNMQLERLPC